MKKTNLIFTLMLCLLAWSCSRQLYMPDSSDPKEQEELMKGRKLYVAHCGSCHYLYLPKKYHLEGWESHMEEMQKLAKIKDPEKDLILKYLTAAHH